LPKIWKRRKLLRQQLRKKFVVEMETDCKVVDDEHAAGNTIHSEEVVALWETIWYFDE